MPLLFCPALYAQQKDKLHYTAKTINMVIEDSNSKTIGESVLGKDVSIVIDTIFKKYTIRYTDEDYKKSGLTLKFLGDYLDKSEDKGIYIYRMEYRGHFYRLVDAKNHPLLRLISITDEQPLKNGNSMTLQMTGLEFKGYL